MLQTDLWRSNDQRLPEVAMHLSSQDVEVVGGRCALRELEIDVLGCQVVELAVAVFYA